MPTRDLTPSSITSFLKKGTSITLSTCTLNLGGFAAKANSPSEKKSAPESISSTSTEKKSSKRRDEHNEICDVCDTGGDLICCDTCNLVFHLKCLRLENVPKGKWSCDHCIVDVSRGFVHLESSITFRYLSGRGKWECCCGEEQSVQTKEKDAACECEEGK